MSLLNLVDVQSGTWTKIKTHLQERLEDLRKKNDSYALDATATASLRGEISAIKYSLALGEISDPAMEADEG